jgi:hypothetical protein
MVSSLFIVMHNHYTNCDMDVRSAVLFRDPPMAKPVQELASYIFLPKLCFLAGTVF